MEHAVLREPRRSEPVAGYKTVRGAAHFGAENMAPGLHGSVHAPSLAGGVRRNSAVLCKGVGQGYPASGRPGGAPPAPPSAACAASSGPPPAAASGAGPSPRGRALSDITNISHGVRPGINGKQPSGVIKPQQQLQQHEQHVHQQPQQSLAQTLPQPFAVRSPPAPAPPATTQPPVQQRAAQPGSARGAAPPFGGDEAYGAAFEGDAMDVQRVADYAIEVHDYLFQEEVASMPGANYMEGQSDINSKMRAILIDWLVEVHMKYRLRPETLFLCVNILDRYLTVRTVMRKRLQLLGVAAMFIASKFEEIDPPKVGEFAYITDNTYTKAEILSMECTVLVALDFMIVAPTPAHFFDRMQRANACDARHRCLAQYILELGLLDIRIVRYPPSMLAAASLLLSNDVLGLRPTWPAAMVHHARHRETDADMSACVQELGALLDQAPKASLQAVRRKYQLDHHCAVANSALRARD